MTSAIVQLYSRTPRNPKGKLGINWGLILGLAVNICGWRGFISFVWFLLQMKGA